MILNFVYRGKNKDELLEVDTDKKEFVYWSDIEVINLLFEVDVKTKADLKVILDALVIDDYAMKI